MLFFLNFHLKYTPKTVYEFNLRELRVSLMIFSLYHRISLVHMITPFKKFLKSDKKIAGIKLKVSNCAFPPTHHYYYSFQLWLVWKSTVKQLHSWHIEFLQITWHEIFCKTHTFISCFQEKLVWKKKKIAFILRTDIVRNVS